MTYDEALADRVRQELTGEPDLTERKMFGGLVAEQNESPSGLLALGIEQYPKDKFINRGVLLDVARFKKMDALAPGYEITAADLEATAKAQGVQVQAGDSVLIRTGYGKFFGDKAKYMGLRPGPGEGAAQWLAGKKVFLTGDDQLTYEVYPEKGTIFPAHRILIADNGIYIVENLNLEELAEMLAARGNYAFALVMNPVRLRGMTGAPLNASVHTPMRSRPGSAPTSSTSGRGSAGAGHHGDV